MESTALNRPPGKGIQNLPQICCTSRGSLESISESILVREGQDNFEPLFVLEPRTSLLLSWRKLDLRRTLPL